jgi:hypothetical protein
MIMLLSSTKYWSYKQAATIPDAEAWWIVVHPPSQFHPMISGNVALVHCLWMVVEIHLHQGKVWRGQSNNFNCHIKDCWLCLVSRSVSAGIGVVVVWFLHGGIWFVFFSFPVLLVCNVWLVLLCPNGVHNCGIAISIGSWPTLLWRILDPIIGLVGS